MNDSNPPRVIFYQVKDNGAKLQRIIETAKTHFVKKEPLLIFVEDARSQQFVDELLWKSPETSFLPHAAADDLTSELIVITKAKANLNQAKAAFNLCPTPLLIEGPFKIIYEFEDMTNLVKKNLSSLRFDAYKQAGSPLEAR